ncbi:MAG TPA: SMC-Scp complex subunit ScpB [Nitrososphaera sp.]|nr:SMC-Scp complex subunit ScpB [Nitrososphaera sp.]
MALPEDEIAARIEAALYSAGRPLSLDELIRASGTNSKEKTQRVVNDLVKKANSTFRAIEIAQLDDGTYVFQLRPQYSPLVRKFAQHPLLPSGALKTLSYVAYEQPVTSKRLVQIRGSQVYSHIKVLEQLQFIQHENLGRLKVYRTTPKFQSYFGITDLSAVKSKLVTGASTTTSSIAKTSSEGTTAKSNRQSHRLSTTKDIPPAEAAAAGSRTSQSQIAEKT